MIVATAEDFKKAMHEFAELAANKAIETALAKHRPMDPWNHYTPREIEEHLALEILEWQEARNHFPLRAELLELKDIAALACSLYYSKVRAARGEKIQ